MSIRRVVPIEQAEWSVAPRPSWVEAHEPDWQFVPPDGHAISFLLIHEQHHAATQAVSLRSVRQPLTHAAVQALGQAEIEFDPAAQRLFIHELAVWRRNSEGVWEKRSLAQREAFLIRQREQQLEQQMLNGRASVVALIEDLRVGDAIELAWTLEPRDPLPGLRFTAFYAFVWTVPVAHAIFTLHRDAAQPAQWCIHAPHDASMPIEEMTPERVSWRMERPPITVPEPNTPSWHWPFPVLDISGWSNWGEVADFVAALWADALADGAEAIAAEAARLRAECDAASSLRAAIRFVQEDVRYLAVDFGHGAGMLPNGAGTVLRRRFGDCKDKAVLLTALLRALGFEAWPMLVGAGWQKAVARVQPSTAAFSHAIVTFLAEGARHFVDPTFIGQGGDLAHLLPPPYGCGLEVRVGVTTLSLLPERPVAEITLTETFDLDRKQRAGAVEQVLHARAWLADDVRAALVRGGRAAFFKARAEALQKHFPALSPREDTAHVADDQVANSIELRASHSLPTWGPTAEKPPAMFRYGAHGLFLAVEFLDGPEQRRQPWLLRHPLRVHHRVVVRGRCVRKTKPERHRFSGPGFRYECDVNARRHEITFDYRWETTQAEIPPEDWPQYRRERGKALDRAGANVATPSVWPPTKQGGIGAAAIAAIIILNVIIAASRNDSSPRSAESSVDHQALFKSKYTQQEAERDMRTAIEAIRRNDFASAAPLLEKVRPYYASSFDYHLMRAETAINTNDFGRAQRAIGAARQIDATNPVTDLIEASLDEKTGKLSEARAILDRLLIRSPGDARALIALGRVTERLGDADAARTAWEKLLAIQPAHPEALMHHALLLWRAGEHERADAAILGAIRAQPTASAALESALSGYFAVTGRFAEAVAPAQRAAELAPDDMRAACNYVLAIGRSGNLREAVDRGQELTRRFPNQPAAWCTLATMAAPARENDIAFAAFEKWLKLAPRDSAVHANYGFFLHKIGRTQDARVMLEKASRDFPGDGLVWFNFAAVLESLGEHDAAADAQKKADRLLSAELRATLLR